MNRRSFLGTAGLALHGAAIGRVLADNQGPPREHQLPESDGDYRRTRSYVEETPITETIGLPKKRMRLSGI